MLVNHRILTGTQNTRVHHLSNRQPDFSAPDKTQQSHEPAAAQDSVSALPRASFPLDTLGSRCSLDMPADSSERNYRQASWVDPAFPVLLLLWSQAGPGEPAPPGVCGLKLWKSPLMQPPTHGLLLPLASPMHQFLRCQGPMPHCQMGTGGCAHGMD